jgi:hypothetical protein
LAQTGQFPFRAPRNRMTSLPRSKSFAVGVSCNRITSGDGLCSSRIPGTECVVDQKFRYTVVCKHSPQITPHHETRSCRLGRSSFSLIIGSRRMSSPLHGTVHFRLLPIPNQLQSIHVCHPIPSPLPAVLQQKKVVR